MGGQTDFYAGMRSDKSGYGLGNILRNVGPRSQKIGKSHNIGRALRRQGSQPVRNAGFGEFQKSGFDMRISLAGLGPNLFDQLANFVIGRGTAAAVSDDKQTGHFTS